MMKLTENVSMHHEKKASEGTQVVRRTSQSKLDNDLSI